MRIGLIAPPWLPVPPQGYGGTEAVLDGLARGLVAAGHSVVLVCHPDSTTPVERVSPPVDLRNVLMGSSAHELVYAVTAYDYLKVLDVDVVHDHTLVGPLYGQRFEELPRVTTNHGPFDHTLLPLYHRVAVDTAVVAISHSQAAGARGVPIAGVVHHGVELSDFPEGTGDGGYVLFLGRMSPSKGVHVAVDVCRRAGVPLVVAAKMREPAEKRYFEEAVRPRLGAGAEYVGEADLARKLELLAGAKALVNPIRWPEPFGMVMLEALACGTPVLAFPSGAAPEIVDHGTTGFLCADEDDLVTALRWVECLDRGACRRAVAERFSLEAMASGYLAVFERAITQRARVARPMRHTLPGVRPSPLASALHSETAAS